MSSQAVESAPARHRHAPKRAILSTRNLHCRLLTMWFLRFLCFQNPDVLAVIFCAPEVDFFRKWQSSSAREDVARLIEKIHKHALALPGSWLARCLYCYFYFRGFRTHGAGLDEVQQMGGRYPRFRGSLDDCLCRRARKKYFGLKLNMTCLKRLARSCFRAQRQMPSSGGRNRGVLGGEVRRSVCTDCQLLTMMS
jgi:hypothetical protein